MNLLQTTPHRLAATARQSGTPPAQAATAIAVERLNFFYGAKRDLVTAFTSFSRCPPETCAITRSTWNNDG